MICYMAKGPNGELRPLTVCEHWYNPQAQGWEVVPVEVREYSEKRKRLEDAAEDLLRACKMVIVLFSGIGLTNSVTADILWAAIAKAEGKQ